MPSFNIPGYSQRLNERGPRGPAGPPGPPGRVTQAPSPQPTAAAPDPASTGGSTNALTLQSQPGSYYLARANHTGINNADQLQGQNSAYHLSRANHTGTNDASLLNAQAASFYLARANHTGTQTFSTITGTVPLNQGGTGAVDAPGARTALGLGTMATQTETNYGALATARTWSAIQTFTPGIVLGTSPTLTVVNFSEYSPTVTAVTNTTVVATGVSQFSRVGSRVTVGGRISVTPTAAGFVRVRVSLPIASAMTLATDVSGSGCVISTTAANIVPVWVQADATNDTFDIGFNAPNTTLALIAFSATYKVI
jgi:hypothetical protein